MRLKHYDVPVAGVIYNDPVLPAQFGQTPYVPAAGERRLMIAILEDAVRCLKMGVTLSAQHPTWRAVGEDAAAWFASDDTTWLFAFRSVCAYLGLSAEAVRRTLPTMRARRHVDRRSHFGIRRIHGPGVPNHRVVAFRLADARRKRGRPATMGRYHRLGRPR